MNRTEYTVYDVTARQAVKLTHLNGRALTAWTSMCYGFSREREYQDVDWEDVCVRSEELVVGDCDRSDAVCTIKYLRPQSLKKTSDACIQILVWISR